jgi:hypothetical protein
VMSVDGIDWDKEVGVDPVDDEPVPGDDDRIPADRLRLVASNELSSGDNKLADGVPADDLKLGSGDETEETSSVELMVKLDDDMGSTDEVGLTLEEELASGVASGVTTGLTTGVLVGVTSGIELGVAAGVELELA